MTQADATRHRGRRKQVRLRIRRDLILTPQTYEGQAYCVVKDPVSLRYWRFREKEYFLLRQMDGANTLEHAQREFEQRFRPDRITLEEVEAFGQHLLTLGIALNDSTEAGDQLLEHSRKHRRNVLVQRLTNLLCIQLPLFDPDRLLARMLQRFGIIFNGWAFLASLTLMAAALVLVGTHFEQFRARLPDAHEFFSARNLLMMWFTLGIVKIIHEFGHGLTCKAFGGEVHEMGALFLCFSPSLYCNVSDAWIFPSKWRRIAVSAAGIYVELVIAALATIVWWNTSTASFLLHQTALSLMVVCSVSTVLFNGNPLLRYDGYYVMADWLEIPNLSQRSNRFLMDLVRKHCLGMRVPPEHAMTPGRKLLFVAYAITSYVYRWVVTFGILWFFYRFLKPYGLGTLGTLLALVTAGSMLGVPLYRMGASIYKRGRLPEMNALRVALTTLTVAALTAAFFLVPLPVSRIRQVGLVQIHPEASTPIHVPVPGIGDRTPGILDQLHVREGQPVEAGHVLAEFRNLELEEELNEARTQVAVLEASLRAGREQTNRGKIDSEANKVRAEMTRLEGERARMAGKLHALEDMKTRLVLRAPRAGVVLGVPHADEIGKQWDRDQTTPFCTIGDPGQLRVLVPLPPADYRLLSDDRAEARRDGSDLRTELRVQGLEGDTWQGRIAELPPAEAREVPRALTHLAGGPVAVKATAASNQFIPQEQQYLVSVEVVDPEPAICPGTRAQVKIHCRWRPAAWWAWRTLTTMFDLGL
jgi:putative peptide zinc metalloprotease protein